MQSLSEKDKANLTAILDSCNKILKFTRKKKNADDFYEDEMAYDASLMNFIVTGEAVAKLSSVIKTRHKEIQWQKIKSFRNIISHEYLEVDPERTWQTIKKHLPQLKRELSAIIKLY